MSEKIESAVRRVIRGAGGPAKVSARFNISRVSVHEWAQNGSIPSDKAPIVAEMAMANGVYVPLEELCPSVAWEVAKAHMDVDQTAFTA